MFISFMYLCSRNSTSFWCAVCCIMLGGSQTLMTYQNVTRAVRWLMTQATFMAMCNKQKTLSRETEENWGCYGTKQCWVVLGVDIIFTDSVWFWLWTWSYALLTVFQSKSSCGEPVRRTGCWNPIRFSQRVVLVAHAYIHQANVTWTMLWCDPDYPVNIAWTMLWCVPGYHVN